MGHYTLIAMKCHLRPDTPEDIRTILHFMSNVEQHWHGSHLIERPPWVALPDHPLFRCQGWKTMLTMVSPYFDEPNATSFDGEHLEIRSYLEGYDEEIGHFADWIGAYIEAERRPTQVPGLEVWDGPDYLAAIASAFQFRSSETPSPQS